MRVISNFRSEFYNTQIEEMPLNVAYVVVALSPIFN